MRFVVLHDEKDVEILVNLDLVACIRSVESNSGTLTEIVLSSGHVVAADESYHEVRRLVFGN